MWLDRIPTRDNGGATADDVDLALTNLRCLLSDDQTPAHVRVQAAREMLRFRSPDSEKLGKKGEQEALRAKFAELYRASFRDDESVP